MIGREYDDNGNLVHDPDDPLAPVRGLAPGKVAAAVRAMAIYGMDIATQVAVRDYLKQEDLLNVGDFKAIVREAGQARKRADSSSRDAAGDTPAGPVYEVTGGCLYWNRRTENGPVPVMLGTFDAEITEEVTLDDGTERTLTWLVRVTAADGRAGEVQITPDQLGRPQQWAAKAAGMSALVQPGLSVSDHLRVAVQSRSRSAVLRTVYTHTGWRHIDGKRVYLTASGALGAGGLDASTAVDLGPLAGFSLPAVPAGPALQEAVRASLSLLELAPDEVMVPVLAAVYRPPLPLAVDCAVWLFGRTGTFKTALTALGQQHFGAAMDAQHLPGNWTSTANALETQAYILDGALFVVDDYSPDSTKVDAQRRAQTADRLIRGAANAAGRARLRPDGTMRPVKDPRAQVLASAEDLPPGTGSLRARVMVGEISPGSVEVTRLTSAQETAADGVLAVAMAGYVQHLASRYDADPGLAGKLAATRNTFRDAARAEGHPRGALNIASLALGWHEWLGYAEASGALTTEEREVLWLRVWKSLCDVGAAQERYRLSADPVHVYLSSLKALIASGRAHLALPDGGKPPSPGSWGWAEDTAGAFPAWRSRGDLVGWIQGDDVYLQPDAAFSAARRFAEGGSAPLTVSQEAVHKHLHERRLLASVQGEGRYTAKVRGLAGKRRNVLHLTAGTFEDGEER